MGNRMMKPLNIKEVLLALAIILMGIAGSEAICFEFVHIFPQEGSRIIYMLAFLEPVFAIIISMSGFFILRQRLVVSREALRERNEALQKALKEKQELGGLLPMCPVCKKVRDDAGYWKHIEEFVEARSKARFTHGICEECLSQIEQEGDVA